MIHVLHLADIINRGDFIHVLLEHCGGPDLALSAATLSEGGSFNASPGSVPVHHLAAPTRHHVPLAVLRLHSLLRRKRVDVIHAHHYLPALVALVASRGTRARLIIGRHYSDSIYLLSTGLRRRLYLALERTCNDSAAAIVAPSTAVTRVLLEQGVDSRKVFQIPYGFDFGRFIRRPPKTATLAEWGETPGWRLATFARLHSEKGHDYFLQALATLLREGTRATWLVVGDGPERSRLGQRVVTLGLEGRVRFTGWRTDVFELMRASDVVVQPTLHEAFSQVMIEAMALGRPLVMTDVSGVADTVRHGLTGIVVPPRDASALASAIRLIVANGGAEPLGAAAYAAVRTNLDIRTVAPRMVALYKNVYSGVHAR